MFILLPFHSRLITLPCLKSKNSLKILSINNTLFFFLLSSQTETYTSLTPNNSLLSTWCSYVSLSSFRNSPHHGSWSPLFSIQTHPQNRISASSPFLSKPFHSPLSLFYMQRENVLQFVPGVCLWETYRCPSWRSTVHTTIYTSRLCSTPCNVSNIWRPTPVKYCTKLQRSGVCSPK